MPAFQAQAVRKRPDRTARRGNYWWLRFLMLVWLLAGALLAAIAVRLGFGYYGYQLLFALATSIALMSLGELGVLGGLSVERRWLPHLRRYTAPAIAWRLLLTLLIFPYMLCVTALAWLSHYATFPSMLSFGSICIAAILGCAAATVALPERERTPALLAGLQVAAFLATVPLAQQLDSSAMSQFVLPILALPLVLLAFAALCTALLGPLRQPPGMRHWLLLPFAAAIVLAVLPMLLIAGTPDAVADLYGWGGVDLLAGARSLGPLCLLLALVLPEPQRLDGPQHRLLRPLAVIAPLLWSAPLTALTAQTVAGAGARNEALHLALSSAVLPLGLSLARRHLPLPAALALLAAAVLALATFLPETQVELLQQAASNPDPTPAWPMLLAVAALAAGHALPKRQQRPDLALLPVSADPGADLGVLAGIVLQMLGALAAGVLLFTAVARSGLAQFGPLEQLFDLSDADVAIVLGSVALGGVAMLDIALAMGTEGLAALWRPFFSATFLLQILRAMALPVGIAAWTLVPGPSAGNISAAAAAAMELPLALDALAAVALACAAMPILLYAGSVAWSRMMVLAVLGVLLTMAAQQYDAPLRQSGDYLCVAMFLRFCSWTVAGRRGAPATVGTLLALCMAGPILTLVTRDADAAWAILAIAAAALQAVDRRALLSVRRAPGAHIAGMAALLLPAPSVTVAVAFLYALDRLVRPLSATGFLPALGPVLALLLVGRCLRLWLLPEYCAMLLGLLAYYAAGWTVWPGDLSWQVAGLALVLLPLSAAARVWQEGRHFARLGAAA